MSTGRPKKDDMETGDDKALALPATNIKRNHGKPTVTPQLNNNSASLQPEKHQQQPPQQQPPQQQAAEMDRSVEARAPPDLDQSLGEENIMENEGPGADILASGMSALSIEGSQFNNFSQPQRPQRPGPSLMTDNHRRILTREFETLATHLITDTMLNHFVSEQILNVHELEKLKLIAASADRAQELLQLLLKKEDRAFYVLINACEKYTMPHLAKRLRDADNDAGTHENSKNAHTSKKPNVLRERVRDTTDDSVKYHLTSGSANDLQVDAEEVAPRDSRTGRSRPIQKPEERGSVDRSKIAPGASKPIEGAVGVTGVANIEIPDEEVPTSLRLPQTDFTILIAETDRADAEELCKTLRSEEDDVTGDCYDVNFVKIGNSTEQVHSLRLAAIASNLQRTTHVLSYITMAFFDQGEVAYFQYQSLGETLRKNSNGEKKIIPIWVDSEDALQVCRERSENSTLASCLQMFEGVKRNNEDNMDKLKEMLKSSKSKTAKKRRIEKQRREINEWKEDEAHKRTVAALLRKQEKLQQDAERAKQLADLLAQSVNPTVGTEKPKEDGMPSNASTVTKQSEDSQHRSSVAGASNSQAAGSRSTAGSESLPAPREHDNNDPAHQIPEASAADREANCAGDEDENSSDSGIHNQ